MKEIEKIKTKKLLEKLENGNFDENDVDNLFMRLRAYSQGNKIFREVADFVAHNDNRNRGITNDSLEAFYLSFKYFLEFTSPKKVLDIGTPFPLYIKKLMKYQVEKCEETELKDKYNVTKQRLTKRIDKLFSEDKENGLATLAEATISTETFGAIQHLLSFIGSKSAFDQKQVISELIKVAKANKFSLNERNILDNSNRITICIMMLLHDATFDFAANKKGFCKISCEKISIPHAMRFIDSNGNSVPHNESFGNLHVLGHVILEHEGKDLTVCYPLMSTNLSAENWCDDEMFAIEPINEKLPFHFQKKINFCGDLYITEKGKIGVIQGEN
jgi:hypothetical protein